MSVKFVVTNIRLEKENWLQVKTIAAEMGMSVNEYINRLAKKDIVMSYFGRANKKTRSKNVYDALATLAKKKFVRKPMGLSDEDNIIYGS